MDNKIANELIEQLKKQGYELDWDWGDENRAALSRKSDGEVICIEIEVNKDTE